MVLEKVNKMNLEELLNCIVCPNIVATQEDVTKAYFCFIHPNTYDNMKRKIEMHFNGIGEKNVIKRLVYYV